MTPDPRMVKLVKAVRNELPDWEPPTLPNGDAHALLDRLAVERLRELLTFAPSWPASVREQVTDAIEVMIRALENDGDRLAAARSVAQARKEAAWSAQPYEWRTAFAAEAAALSAAWTAHVGAWASLSVARAAQAAAQAAAWATDAAWSEALTAAWQREADRITAAVEEQS